MIWVLVPLAQPEKKIKYDSNRFFILSRCGIAMPILVKIARPRCSLLIGIEIYS